MQGLTARERLLGLTAAALLAVAATTASMMSPADPVAQQAVVPAPVPVTTPSTSPTPSPRPVTRPAPRPRVVDRPLPPAPPRTGCPVPPYQGGEKPKPRPAPIVAESALPAPLPVTAKAASLAVVKGKGLWATPWPRTTVDVEGLVAQARATGVRSIWIRTGGSRQGYYGDAFLPALVPAAHRAGLRVIAWDFPFLSDPVGDAVRAKRALDAGADAFSPDVETAAEGTYVTTRRLRVYLSLVRSYAGQRPVIATVPRPSPARKTFPYAAFVPYADVFAPMVYWSCKEPGALVQQALRTLAKLLPVAPVGQAYDMGHEGGRRGTPSRAETLRFLDAARRAGAIGASLWTVEHASPAQLKALADYRWR
ncbi:MAG TPA: hypothetical protein VMZ11_00235 [Mycobacteriales bacterium]|nr:hypothetical protein [Mycobacteriales bacterium]